jgi:hypothetical protein
VDGEELPGQPQRAIDATPLGYVDHSPFSGFGSELIYGQRADGTQAHISEVANGLACGCICPACEQPLIARQGKKLIAHFAHAAENGGCGTGAETNAHIWAKEVLARTRYILLPEVAAYDGDKSYRAYGARKFRFASARLERKLGNIVPDVILTTAKGQELLVEALVTHACDEEKIAKLRALELATIEVDLSAYRTSQDRAAIEAALIETAPREWLYNRKVDAACETLAARIKAAEARAAEAERQRVAADEARRQAAAAKAQHAFDAAVAKLVAAYAKPKTARPDYGRDHETWVITGGHGDLLLPVLGVAGFRVQASRWQAVLVDHILNLPARHHILEPSFSAERLLRLLEDAIDDAFREPVPDAVAAEFRSRTGAACLPRDAIAALLDHLCARDILEKKAAGHVYSPAYQRLVYDADEKRMREERRQRDIDRAMARILFAIRHDPQGDFAAEAWQAAPVPPFGKTLGQLVEGDTQEWTRFEAALGAIERMIEGGPVARETLGLPLAGAIARAKAAAAAVVRAGAPDREARLREAAFSWLGSPTDAWLDSSDGDTPVALARTDEAGFTAALASLDQERRARIVQRAIDTQRAKLRIAAEKALGKELAEPFLHNFDRGLDSSPWNHCTDAPSLHHCLAALDQWVARKRK